MPFQLTLRRRQRKSPSELVGIDIATTGVKVIRMKKGKDGIGVVAADILPPLQAPSEGAGAVTLGLPKPFLANYTAMAASAAAAVVRILSLPGHGEKELGEDQIREQVGLGKEYRIAHIPVSPQRGKGESKILVVGIPEEDAQAVLALVKEGPPAPFSFEVAGLSALTAFLVGPGEQHAQEAVGVIESGARVTYMALFYKNLLSLVRKFDFGTEALVEKVQSQLGVDRETAQGIVSDGSFDISQPVHDVMDPFLRQLLISRDFVERREDCRVTKLYVSGGASLSRYWVSEVQGAVGVEVDCWNPLGGLPVAPGAIPENLAGQETRLTAAVGACLGVWSES